MVYAPASAQLFTKGLAAAAAIAAPYFRQEAQELANDSFAYAARSLGGSIRSAAGIPRRTAASFSRPMAFTRSRRFGRRRRFMRRSRRVYRRKRYARRKPRFRRSRRRFIKRRRTRRFQRRYRSTFKRRQRRPRRYFRGTMMDLTKKMVMGESLPYIGFGRARYAGVHMWYPYTADSTNYDPSTFQINAIVGAEVSSPGKINYGGLYNVLYDQYLVLGAKFVVNLQPCPVSHVPTGTVLESQSVTGPKPGNHPFSGYWYMRFYYPGLNNASMATDSIGVPINLAASDSASADLPVRWKREIDFLQDKSVIYTKDMRSWYSAYHEQHITNATTYTNLNRELGVWVKARGPTLKFKFSAKKQYRQQNILAGHFGTDTSDENPFWADWASVPSVPFLLRFGYVAFDYSSNGAASQTLTFFPPLLQAYRCQVSIDYYLAMRMPTNLTTLETATGLSALVQARAEKEALAQEARQLKKSLQDGEEL